MVILIEYIATLTTMQPSGYLYMYLQLQLGITQHTPSDHNARLCSHKVNLNQKYTNPIK